MHLRHSLVRKTMVFVLGLAFGLAGIAFAQAPAVSASQAKVNTADQVISLGKKYLGVKYRLGAPSGSTKAFDCSSFTQYIFGENGVELPRSSADQAKEGVKVAKDSLKKGDLVFFKTPKRTGSKIGHVAVYIGNNKILHTYKSTGVTVSTLDGYWEDNYVTARRVL
ncbi:C40 family peptidase [Cohnella caldifontis]|uniref:C40 family peptidase n=1 Tax=Cohnella caldifontis TaxID=3027471 RepID=UPI0023ECB8DE|nr:C40 family peptidase [Cohnella sp. YIM B05605]